MGRGLDAKFFASKFVGNLSVNIPWIKLFIGCLLIGTINGALLSWLGLESVTISMIIGGVLGGIFGFITIRRHNEYHSGREEEAGDPPVNS